MGDGDPGDLRDRLVQYRANRRLPSAQAGARISAYVYGNIIAFASVVALKPADLGHGHALALVAGVTVSTFVAHVFADLVGSNADDDETMTGSALRHELRDSMPVVTSALVPCVLMGVGWAGWLNPRTVIAASAFYLMVRMALVGFVIERLRHRRPSPRTLVAGLALAVAAAAIGLLKTVLSH
ncbi:hypothetical protein AMIS_28700 [Actinoplanes missouriensis 431]|uniref:Integral membrane protein n=1 Tax=Actinoplanes missouriensis (strain ATCC 14538 / DSM 43046 / CBS 188.64 / JCM 3121 / NBRC 102363 / NCIMB 12654 / NRRL B-3342 / UNCC 431) TaxID=512565 RepID=I0H503_ACTM4|nr:hypothetical protein [Actinoplanes missouriensis]BAL88090.1 hypothetical protein AMIS_28700 [Actinoplanes missouriensis 431]